MATEYVQCPRKANHHLLWLLLVLSAPIPRLFLFSRSSLGAGEQSFFSLLQLTPDDAWCLPLQPATAPCRTCRSHTPTRRAAAAGLVDSEIHRREGSLHPRDGLATARSHTPLDPLSASRQRSNPRRPPVCCNQDVEYCLPKRADRLSGKVKDPVRSRAGRHKGVLHTHTS